MIVGIAVLFGSQPATADPGHLELMRASGTIRIATNPGIEPMEFLRGGQLVGYDIDLGAALAKHLNVGVKWIVFDDFEELVGYVIDGRSGGQFEVVISAMGIDDERTRSSIAVPYYKSGLTILTTVSDHAISTLGSLDGKRVAAVVGSSEHGIAGRQPGVTLVEVRNYDQCVGAVLRGDADAAVLDVPMALVAAKRHTGRLRVVDEPFEEEWYGVYMENSEKELFREIRRAVKEMLGVFRAWMRCKHRQWP